MNVNRPSTPPTTSSSAQFLSTPELAQKAGNILITQPINAPLTKNNQSIIQQAMNKVVDSSNTRTPEKRKFLIDISNTIYNRASMEGPSNKKKSSLAPDSPSTEFLQKNATGLKNVSDSPWINHTTLNLCHSLHELSRQKQIAVPYISRFFDVEHILQGNDGQGLHYISETDPRWHLVKDCVVSATGAVSVRWNHEGNGKGEGSGKTSTLFSPYITNIMNYLNNINSSETEVLPYTSLQNKKQSFLLRASDGAIYETKIHPKKPHVYTSIYPIFRWIPQTELYNSSIPITQNFSIEPHTGNAVQKTPEEIIQLLKENPPVTNTRQEHTTLIRYQHNSTDDIVIDLSRVLQDSDLKGISSGVVLSASKSFLQNFGVCFPEDSNNNSKN